jgi:hypothetical protein
MENSVLNKNTFGLQTLQISLTLSLMSLPLIYFLVVTANMTLQKRKSNKAVWNFSRKQTEAGSLFGRVLSGNRVGIFLMRR